MSSLVLPFHNPPHFPNRLRRPTFICVSFWGEPKQDPGTAPPLESDEGNQVMKIAFMGSHGVGKTTLCFDVAARLKRLDLGVDLVKEVARACPLPINKDTTVEAQAWILHTQIAEELAAEARYEVVVCDRSVLDNYAYLVHQAGRRPEYDGLVREWMGSYDGLFKVPILHPPSFDGTRDTSGTFQSEVDWVIDRLLGGALGIPLPPGPRRQGRMGGSSDSGSRATSPSPPDRYLRQIDPSCQALPGHPVSQSVTGRSAAFLRVTTGCLCRRMPYSI